MILLIIWVFFFFNMNSEKTFRTCTLAPVRSSFFPPSLGWVPPLSVGDRAQFVCLGRAPFFPVALWRPGPSLGVLCGSRRSGTCCRGSGQGQEGWAYLGCLPTAASVGFFGWPLPICIRYHKCPRVRSAIPWRLPPIGFRAILWEGEITFPDPSWGPAFSFHLRSHQSWADPTHYWSQLGIKQQCYSHQTDQ